MDKLVFIINSFLLVFPFPATRAVRDYFRLSSLAAPRKFASVTELLLEKLKSES